MKKLMMLVVFVILLVMPISANAGACERYWDELTNQCFEVTVDDIKYTACFSDSYFGPCPGGIVILSYTDIQIIDGIEYEAEISINLSYSTTAEYVTVEGLLFALSDGQLILLPDDPWIFDIIEEDIL